MEANYEEQYTYNQSPRLVAVHPNLLPVPSEGWNEEYMSGIDIPQEVYELASEDDAYDAGIKRAAVLPWRFKQKNGDQATKQTFEIREQSQDLISLPGSDEDSDDDFSSFAVDSQRKPPGLQKKPDWLPSRTARTAPSSLPQIQQLRLRRFRKRFDLPLLFRVEKEVVEVMACPDSGSDDNIISENFTKVLGLRIEQLVDKTKHFSLANGKTIHAVGQVSAQFSFALGSSPDGSLPECVFYVFSSLAVSVIMGMEFLQQTETLTKHTDRMIEQLVPSMQALRVNSIGKAKKNLVCRLGPYTGLASPDTGSDLDLVSPGFARSRAFTIIPAQETLQFADCSIGYTSGVIRAAFAVGRLDDCEGFIPKGVAQVSEFHVLDNLTTDIILGQETIEALDIFTEHADSMIPSIPSLGESDVNIIRHIGAVEAFCSRKWRTLKIKDKDGTSVTARDLTTATQRENARLDTARSRYQKFDEATVAAFDSVKMSAVEEARRAAVEVAADNTEVKTQHSRIPNLTTRRKRSLNLRPLPWSAFSPIADCPPASDRPVSHDSQSETSSDLRYCVFSGCTAAPFMTQYLLDSHVNEEHSQRRPHFCPVSGCSRSEGGKGFRRKIEMIRHGLVHESPGYVCPFCPDREHKYPRPDNLQRHVRVHHLDETADNPLLQEVLSRRLDRPSRVQPRPRVPVLVDWDEIKAFRFT